MALQRLILIHLKEYLYTMIVLFISLMPLKTLALRNRLFDDKDVVILVLKALFLDEIVRVFL